MTEPPAPSSECQVVHDPWTLTLSLGLCFGLVISYLPQHLRIIRSRSSEGFSPWYLLLGATSSASSMLNLLAVQWPLFRCCKVVTAGRCFESLLGFVQVTLQWLLFTIILILYLVYFPHHLKYQRAIALPPPNHATYGSTTGMFNPNEPVQNVKPHLSTTPEWRLAVTLGWFVALHLVFLTLLSLTLLYVLPATVPPHRLLSYLATFLGVSATLLAVLQYAPQIYKTFNAKLVGALSIGTMVIQVPGSVLFVVSLVVRPGTNWTSWLAYAVTGAMQGSLLIICLIWKRRQKQLGMDDFGNPAVSTASASDERQALLTGEERDT